MAAESRNSSLGKLKDEMKAAGMIQDPNHAPANAGLEGLEKAKEICEKLKTLSYQALSDQTPLTDRTSRKTVVPTKQ